MAERERTDIRFEIVERIGVLGSYPTGWNKEFNVVKWNDKPEKYDIRDWSPGHERMSRGVTMHEDELLKLMDFCSVRFEDEKTAAEVQQAVADAAGSAGQAQEEVPF